MSAFSGLKNHWGKAVACSTALATSNFLYEAFTTLDWDRALEISFFQVTAILVFVFIWLRERAA